MRLPRPYYKTAFGSAYLGDAFQLMQSLPDESVDLIMTSPPFALQRKKEYGNVDAEDYVAWFMPFAFQFKRVLKERGSLVIDMGGSWIKGQPTRSLYHLELLVALCRKAAIHLT
jgi:site-specific DNA-methyltransferase (cytosine-N4-specific)